MAIKKIELHVHLEGTISPALAKILASRNHLTVPPGVISSSGDHYLFRDFLHFLSVFDIIAGLIKTPQDYYDLTFDYLRSSARDDVMYVEMMYSPEHAEKMTGIPSIEHLQAIQQAITDAHAQFGIVGRIIIVAVRHFGVDASIRTAERALQERLAAVVGFGLGGDELNFPPQLFKQAFAIASEGGLLCTAHAGEFGDAKSMLVAIESLPIQRIGHGVQAIHSPDLMKLLKDRNIALEVCPSSNIVFGVFKDIAHHPFPDLLKAGISVSINSDDPPFVRTTVAKEYALVQAAYGYSDIDMTNITRSAVEHSFADQDLKMRLLKQLD